MSFSPPRLFFPPTFYLIRFQQMATLVRVCVCTCAFEHVACASAVFQPRGHASGAGSRYICHCLNRVASIFGEQVSLAPWRTDTSSLPLSSVSRPSSSLLSPQPITSFCWPLSFFFFSSAVSALFIISALFRSKPKRRQKTSAQPSPFGTESRLLKVINFSLKLTHLLRWWEIKWLMLCGILVSAPQSLSHVH